MHNGPQPITPAGRATPLRALEFTPSQVEGLDDVRRIVVHADRLEFIRDKDVVVVHYREIARRIEPRIVSLLKRVVGLRPCPPDIADRDWFHDPPDMFFILYTQPRIKFCMPADESKESYADSWFRRIQDVIQSGGYDTFDLG